MISSQKKFPKVYIEDVKAELCRREFFYFLKEFIHVTIREEMIWNWHIKYLCEKLQEYGERIIKKQDCPNEYLIINVPPSSSKSTIISQFFPVWLWINDFTLTVISLSYSESLAVRHGMRSRDIMNDKKFKLYFPHLEFKSDQNNKKNFEIDKGGARIITSVGGSVTGAHGDCIIVDDPMNVEQSVSKVERANANDFVRHTLPSRKKNSKTCPTIIIMQRLHEEDTTGMLLAEMPEMCEHICLPAEESKWISPIELKEKYSQGLLDPIRLSIENLQKKKLQLGSYNYAGQYSQIPAPDEGGILKKEWFKIIQPHEIPFTTTFYCCDTAYTENEKNDPSGYLAYRINNGNLYLMNFQKGHYEFTRQIEKLPQFVRENNYSPVSIIYVEPKSSGKDLVSILKKQTQLNIREDENPTKDKEARLNDVAPFIEAGRVYLCLGNWNQSFIEQCSNFPNAKHDEEVDCLVMAARKAFLKRSLKFI